MNRQWDEFIEKNCSILRDALEVFMRPETADRCKVLWESGYSFEDICRDALMTLCLEARNLAAELNEWEEDAPLLVALAAHQDLLNRLGEIAGLCANPGEGNDLHRSVIDLVGAMDTIVRQSVEAFSATYDAHYQNDHQLDHSHLGQESFQIADNTAVYLMSVKGNTGPMTSPVHGEILGVYRTARESRHPESQEPDDSRPKQGQIPGQKGVESRSRLHPAVKKKDLFIERNKLLTVWIDQHMRFIREDNSTVLGRLPKGGVANILVVMKESDLSRGVALVDGDRYNTAQSSFYNASGFIFIEGFMRVARKGRFSDPGELQVSGIDTPEARNHVRNALNTKKRIEFVQSI
ncbi:hypothetical protein [Streptomyces cinereoruber]|uniref:hypothetical protein n=1 Tax=Streptomyces cinereoruber TaxID=67260 RepID=UPI003660FCDF